MGNWKATTESGAVYEMDDGFVRITPSADSKLWPTTIRAYAVMISREPVKSGAQYPLPWADPSKWDDTRGPTVGHLLYVSGKDEWRVSTPIQSVEKEEENGA